MDGTDAPGRPAAWRVVPPAVVLVTGLALVVLQARDGSGFGVVVAALQAVAGAYLTVWTLRERRRRPGGTDV